MSDNTEVRILIEEAIEKHCDGTFLNGLKSATFVGEPQVCADEIIAIVFGILEDEEAALRARAEKAEAALRKINASKYMSADYLRGVAAAALKEGSK